MELLFWTHGVEWVQSFNALGLALSVFLVSMEQHEDLNGRVKTTNKRILVLLVLFVVHGVSGRIGTLSTIYPERDNVPKNKTWKQKQIYKTTINIPSDCVSQVDLIQSLYFDYITALFWIKMFQIVLKAFQLPTCVCCARSSYSHPSHSLLL